VKLISFVFDARPSYGVVEGGDLLDVGAVLAAHCADLKAILAEADPLALLRDARGAAPRLDLASVTRLPPVPNPGKIFCIGHNYEEHRLEAGRPKTDFPAVFLRFADSQVAHGQDACIPLESTHIDFEGELAVVIGRGGRRIPRGRALEHVAGYSCYNDISVRDWQKHTSQFAPGKNFPRTGAFGPWLVTADEIADPQNLELTTRLNGTVMQHARTDQMIFQVAELIEYCSTFTVLSAGDVIVSGTPGGVGARRTPPVFMKAGDTVEIEIESIGTLRNTLVNEAR
jgi:2-keto-4-pentenoate hydratase/2-oxohepta-3-ene-1,7-dioic acid hydratase in catechol pathway